MKPVFFLALSLCFLAGCGNSGVIDFTDGKFEFLAVDESPVEAARTRLSLVDYQGGKAVKADISGIGAPFIVIDASSLLGKRVSELRTMEITLGLEREDDEFFAVSGEIRAYSGQNRAESTHSWSVYLPEKNPNTARAVLKEGGYFVPNAYNFFVLTRKVDNALEAGKDPSAFVISRIRFLDSRGREIRANSRAAFRPPPGFGERDTSNLLPFGEELAIEKASGASRGGWGQAVALDTVKNGGGLDPAVFGENTVVMVYYRSDSPPELILQSWSGGSGWAKVAPAAFNNSVSCAQFHYADMIAAFGSPDFTACLDKFYVGDTGKELKVYAVTVAQIK
ncbi:hypothetical protein AGMMS50293_16010 [Spirochaetia bacterium]|nr:hypothetical protein AGMMS50293_16010 [Spirochaetia bacterium]